MKKNTFYLVLPFNAVGNVWTKFNGFNCNQE